MCHVMTELIKFISISNANCWTIIQIVLLIIPELSIYMPFKMWFGTCPDIPLSRFSYIYWFIHFKHQLTHTAIVNILKLTYDPKRKGLKLHPRWNGPNHIIDKTEHL